MSLTKKSLRQTYLDKRAALSDETFQDQSEVITRRLTDHIKNHYIDIRQPIFHTYIAISENKEIDVSPVISWTWAYHPLVQWAAPKVIPGQKRIEHIPIFPSTTFQTSSWGIPEPVGMIPIPPAQIHVAITPLLCFDTLGRRIGYGGGYYDRFFEESPTTVRIGVSLFPPIDSIPEAQTHDLPLDACITPDKIWEWER